MFHFKSKKIALSLLFSALTVILFSALTQAEETYGTGNIASSQAEQQRAAIAKRKERIKMEKEAEAKKAAEALPTTTQQPPQNQADKSASQ
ncbi:MAG: hypothetical protein IPN42_18945 [Methylococcaceae bacterium]|nr:hypothetical protein [Methylococcaceae bacterium]